MPTERQSDPDALLKIGRHEVLIRRRYEAMSIANDVLIALWYVAGSILLFWESTSLAGRWLFLMGGLQFLARPTIRLARRIHLRRWGRDGQYHGASFDY